VCMCVCGVHCSIVEQGGVGGVVVVVGVGVRVCVWWCVMQHPRGGGGVGVGV